MSYTEAGTLTHFQAKDMTQWKMEELNDPKILETSLTEIC